VNILEVRNMSHSFGGLVAIRDLSFNVKQGSIQALIGPNGSGKSTAFDIIAGSILARSGQIEFESHPIMGLKPVELVCRGLCRTFQATQIFEDFTVQET
jgi:branched-chain amino acid transport system ATP-binding protein